MRKWAVARVSARVSSRQVPLSHGVHALPGFVPTHIPSEPQLLDQWLAVSRPLNERGQERQERPLVVGCSTETGSDAGKVFLRASSSASSWCLRLSLSPLS